MQTNNLSSPSLRGGNAAEAIQSAARLDCFAALAMTLMFIGMVALFPFTAQAQLIGTDSVPGDPCTAKGAVRMTANATGPGAYILTCDGDSGQWVATINAGLPTANAQVANKEYVDSAVAAGSLAVCTDDYASLCALETNRAGNDPQFVPENIVSGVNILGVTGNYTGGGGGLSGPAGCPDIGDQCADTTIFAGFHPITHDHLFIPPTDQDGGSGLKWKVDAQGNGDHINPDSFVDGRANHTNIQIAIGNLPAMDVCANLTLAGKTWYLPARAELDYIYNNRANYVAKSPGNNFTDFQNAYYWSSTEYNTSNAWVQHFTIGNISNTSKANALRVRCVAR